MTEECSCNDVRFINNPEHHQIPSLIHDFLSDLNESGMDFEGANKVMSKHQQLLHPQGWRFHSLNDAWAQEWNIACTPPESLQSFCLQRFNAIKDDPWECYIVEKKA